MPTVQYPVTGLTDPFAVGIPPNNGVHFDGVYFWLFYVVSGELRCKYGTDLTSLTDTPTDVSGSGNVGNIRNSGRCYSLVFGQIAGTNYAWCLYSQTDLGRGYVLQRWQLSASGLTSAIESAIAVSNLNRIANSLTPNYSGDVAELLGASQIWDSSASTRFCNADLTGDTGLGSVDSVAMDFPEHTRVFQLSDGYLAFATDEGDTGEINGNFGHAREWTRSDLSTAWSTETTIEGAVVGASSGNGDFTDQNYATDTSHIGQQDMAQTSDGRIWAAYCDNADLTNGNYGVVKLVQRGSARADGWSLVSSDVIGSGIAAWHVALASNGTDLWIVYVKNNAGLRDSAIYYRKYSVALNTFGAEVKLADMQVGFTFERMFAQWRFVGSTLVVAWSETNGTTYDIGVGVDIEISVLPDLYPHEVLCVAKTHRAFAI